MTGRGSTRPGRQAALPPETFRPSTVTAGQGGSPVVEFAGEDGRTRCFDFADCPLPGWHEAAAPALARRVGGAGGLRTSSSSLAAWNNLRAFLRFLSALDDCPTVPADLTEAQTTTFLTAQTTRLGVAYGCRTTDQVWQVLRLPPLSGQISPAALNALRVRAVGAPPSGTPGYSDRELALILAAARRDVSALRERLHAGQDLLSAEANAAPVGAGHLAAAWRDGVVPAEVGGWLQRQTLAEPLFVTRRDVPALLVLLVSVTGRNIETIKELTAEHLVLADRAVEVRLVKRRRGAGHWSETVTWEIGPPGRELHHPGGLYLLLDQLMGPARRLSSDPDSFWAVWRNLRHQRDAHAISEIANPFRAALTAGIEMRRWAMGTHNLVDDNGDPMPVTFKRLRTSVEVRRTRRMGGHLPSAARSNTAAVLFRNYLRADPVARDWAQDITSEALVAAEDAALAAYRAGRRAATPPTVTQSDQASPDGEEGPWSRCRDVTSHPATGRPCRASFLDCFHCGNCMITGEHLPRLLALSDALEARRRHLPEAEWWDRYGPAWAAIGRDVLPRFTPAEISQARQQPSPDPLLDLVDEPWERS